MPNLADFDLVIFDCDGVLVDTEPLSNRVLARHATHLGWEMDGEHSRKLFLGMTMTQVHKRIEAELGQTLDPAWIEAYYTDSFDLFRAELTAIDGVEALIKRVISAGKKICVASQGPHEKMCLTLGLTGLAGYFGDHIFSARDVARPKPFPDLFEHAAAQMGATAETCCVIEDSTSGVTAALAAHMRVIRYAQEPLPNASNSVVTVTSMSDIFAKANG